MKVAFTSCMDHVNDPAQAAWDALASHNPDVLVLLGDNIYMDYGLGPHQFRNGDPKSIPIDQFSAVMHSYYSAQWEVPAFQDAIQDPDVHAIWDDHDFGWNNSRAGGPNDGSPEYMTPKQRSVSRAHFQQFRQALVDKPPHFPANTVADPDTEPDLGHIYQHVDLTESTRLFLLDGRTFREPRSKANWLLGETQWAWMTGALLPKPSINIIASGTTLKDWKRYRDYEQLRQLGATHNLLVLSGDVHEPDIKSLGKIVEATASAMAQPPGPTAIFGKKSGVFGVLDIGDAFVDIEIFQGTAHVDHARIDIAHWEQVE